MTSPTSLPTLDGALEICARVLCVDEVATDDSFVDLGGDSLTAVELAAELSDYLGTDVEMEVIVEQATLGQAIVVYLPAGGVEAP